MTSTIVSPFFEGCTENLSVPNVIPSSENDLLLTVIPAKSIKMSFFCPTNAVSFFSDSRN